jgi:LacI family transcriptional regulator
VNQSADRPRIPTIRDVARTAGVSLGTASRVINRQESVKAEIRARVESAIVELGYTPNAVAQSMRSRNTKTVGCIVRDISIPVLAAFVRAAQHELDRAGYALLLANSEGQRERETRFLLTLAARKVDALLIGQYSEGDEGFHQVLKSLGIPVVLVEREMPLWASAVMVDHCTAVKQATEHLLGLGHRRIALLTGNPDLFPAHDRIKGYELAHAACGVAVDAELVRKDSFLADYSFRQTDALMSSGDPPTAIIAGGIDMLSGILRALRARGLKTPQDVSLVAASDSDLASLSEPPISVERWDYAKLGQVAAKLALDAIRDGPAAKPQRVLVPAGFLLRDSCGPPRRG